MKTGVPSGVEDVGAAAEEELNQALGGFDFITMSMGPGRGSTKIVL